jgi:hypothetical protein
MKNTILIAGATGNLGGKIVTALLEKEVNVRAIVRKETDRKKIVALEKQGVEVIEANLDSLAQVKDACKNVSCLVSALQGLKDVIVDTQSVLLEAAVAAGVPRFIPSDYSVDFTQLPYGINRNFDLRKEFLEKLDKAPIAGTSIFNGAFAELLSYNIPLLDFKKDQVCYWENADWRIDFTTMDNTAAYTAAVAVDEEAPEILRIASFQISAIELATLAGQIKNKTFDVVRLGDLTELADKNKQDRLDHPEGEKELYPFWQQNQYTYSMFSVNHEKLDNTRYPELSWTTPGEVLQQI